MSIQSPALRETPLSLLSSRPAWRSTPFARQSVGNADLFASVLNAQNSRSGPADVARTAQKELIAGTRNETAESRSNKAHGRDRVRAEESKERRTDASEDDRDTEHAKESDRDADGTRDGVVDALQTEDIETQAVVKTITVQPIAAESVASGTGAADHSDGSPATIHTRSQSIARETVVIDEQRAVAAKQQESAVRDGVVREGEQAKQKEMPQRDVAADVQNAKRAQSAVQETVEADQVELTIAKQAVARPVGSTSDAEVVDAAVEAVRQANATHERRAATDTVRQSESKASSALEDSQVRRNGRRNDTPVQRDGTAITAKAMKDTNPNAVAEATQREIDALINGEGKSSDMRELKFQREVAPQQIAPDPTSARPTVQANAQPVGHTPALDIAVGTTSAPAGTSTMSATTGAAAFTSPGLAGDAALAQSSPSANGTDWMTRNDHAAGRILRGMTAMVGQNGGTMTMRLDPPELGALRIQMSISNGTVSASFAASEGAARGLLEQNLGQLRTALESQGLIVEKLSIHGAQQSQHGTQTGSQQSSDGRQGHEQQSQHSDAGQGESRGRQEYEGQREQAHRSFFDPSTIFDANEHDDFASRFLNGTNARIPA